MKDNLYIIALHQEKIHKQLVALNSPPLAELKPIANPRVIPVVDIPIGPMRQSDYGPVGERVIFSNVYDKEPDSDYILMQEAKVKPSKCVIL